MVQFMYMISCFMYMSYAGAFAQRFKATVEAFIR